MTEYTDLKNRTYRGIEIVRDHSRERKSEEPRESAERQNMNVKRTLLSETGDVNIVWNL